MQKTTPSETLLRRRPRRIAIGEVSITSASTVYVNNDTTTSATDDNGDKPAAHAHADPVYENTVGDTKPQPPQRNRRNRAQSSAGARSQQSTLKPLALRRHYTVVCRQLERVPIAVRTPNTPASVDKDGADDASSTVETQHVSLFIGESKRARTQQPK